MLRFVLAFALLADLARGAPAPVRLPEGARPLVYRLALDIDPARPRFSGTVEIDVELASSTSLITLHGRGLDVRAASVLAGERTIAATFRQLDEDGRAELALASPVGPGRVTLRLAWSASFDGGLVGLYRVSERGRWFVYSQLEATYARRVWPCFDEPDFKTPIELTLTTPAAARAIANTAPLSTVKQRGHLITRFHATPPLPTYLVGIAVGPLAFVEAPLIPASSVRATPLPLRGVTSAGHERDLGFALAETPAIVKQLEDYFGAPFPFSKIDLVAVPDFSAGAMENAGIITFRDTWLLLDESTATIEQRLGIVETIAHELAHHWFGDAVTMAWWDDLWLNESFATWMEARVVEAIHPEWRAQLEAAVSSQNVMSLDELVSTRRIAEPIASAHDIQNAFDGITYQKGGAVLRMFERSMGAEKFRAGVRAHVAAHNGGNATSADLLRALDEASGKGDGVSSAFRTFLEQPGVPLVEAKVECGPAGGRLSLRQSRSLRAGSTGDRARRWQVPVCARWPKGDRVVEACTLLVNEVDVMELGQPCPAWVMPNAGGAGYYRFTLPRGDLVNLMDKGWPHLDEPERVALAGSLASAFSSAALPAGDVLDALGPIVADEESEVVQQATGLLEEVREQLVSDADRPRLEARVRALLAPAVARLGWDPSPGESPSRRSLRANLLSAMASIGRDPATRAEARQRAARLLGIDKPVDDKAVAPELTGIALEVYAQDGGVKVVDKLSRALVGSRDAWVRGELVHAIGAVESPPQAKRALALAMSTSLRTVERSELIHTLAGHVTTRALVWDWFRPLADRLILTLPEEARGQVALIAEGFCSEPRAVEVERFFAPRVAKLPGGPRNLAQVVEGIRLCAALVAAQSADVRRWLDHP